MMQHSDTLVKPARAVPSLDEPMDPIDAPEPAKAARRWWPVGALVIFVLAVTLALPGVRHQWALSFVRQPTHFTALSFEGASNLPATIAPGAPVRLTFNVANNEGRSVAYPYVVTSTDARAGAVVLHSATITVPSGSARSSTVSVVPACTSSPCRVQVTLPGHGESINVLLHVTTPAS
jgi:hypothetical protein